MDDEQSFLDKALDGYDKVVECMEQIQDASQQRRQRRGLTRSADSTGTRPTVVVAPPSGWAHSSGHEETDLGIDCLHAVGDPHSGAATIHRLMMKPAPWKASTQMLGKKVATSFIWEDN
ncbi:MAG: hypothetical protein FRX49_10238 [Trebouxia sp. A1-2]|nr:MAG: hypothetical protein FRX49_10238 [Trebouxia sp. A1-2]